MKTFAAFLRGINVGGNKLIKMDELKKVFENCGFKNVKTILASGNVIFDSAISGEKAIAKTIEENINKKFKLDSCVTIRSVDHLKALHKLNPFEKIEVNDQTRLYLTFLSSKFKDDLKIPYKSDDGNFRILKSTDTELFSVLTLSPQSNTIDLMDILQKKFGKKITTRNWNTIERILKACNSE